MKREKIFQSVRLGTSILVSALTGCASLHDETVQPVAAFGERSDALGLSDSAVRDREPSISNQWAAQYPYRGGRNPMTG
jgi:hypothetical protein